MTVIFTAFIENRGISFAKLAMPIDNSINKDQNKNLLIMQMDPQKK